LKSLTAFWNKHLGETAFVLGSGPSLRHADVAKMHAVGKIITINSAVMHATRPDYHVLMDGAAPYLQSFDLVVASDAVVACSSQVGSRGLIPEDRIIPFTPKPCAPLVPNVDYLSQWCTTAITAVHFAIVLGFKRIILIGCDCAREAGKRYFHDFWDPPTDDPMVNAFTSTGFDRPFRRIIGLDRPAKKYTDYPEPPSCAELREWPVAAKLVSSDVRVIDASNGRIACFPKVQIGDILK